MMIRVFVAVHVPRTEAADGLRSDLKAAGARTVPPDQTHITLSFIGDIDEKKVGRVTECVRRAVDGFSPFEVSVSGTGAFPNESRPSVVWMGVEPAGLLRAIARNLDGALTAAGIGHDSKPFKAHVTVARCRDGLNARGLFERHSRTGFCSFECREVLVMKSVLSPKGAEHTVLARVPLKERV